MDDHINWNSTFEIKSPQLNYKFTCFRCNTKNTHALIYGIITGDEIKVPTELYNKESFVLIKCSTCGAFTIAHHSYKGKKWLTTNLPGIRNRKMEFDEPQTSYFPLQISIEDIPEIVREDYRLMHGCKLIGSNQGVSVHYRRMLDKIFTEYEKKYLSEDERKIKRIKDRAKKIYEKNIYFKDFNETIINLKGIVSSVVHDDLENLELSLELKITPEDFEKLDGIILFLLKVYELEFKDLPAIKDKSERINKLKK